MPRDKYNTRRAPTDLDEAPPAPVLEFDYSRVNEYGKPTWPERHFGQRFGPSLVRKAQAAGLHVLAEVREIPYPIVIKQMRWADADTLEVLILEGWRRPNRIFTRDSVKNLTIGGILKERKET